VDFLDFPRAALSAGCHHSHVAAWPMETVDAQRRFARWALEFWGFCPENLMETGGQGRLRTVITKVLTHLSLG